MTVVRAVALVVPLLVMNGTYFPPAGAPGQSLARVAANDNRHPAGVLRGDTLTIRLDVGMAVWHPEADDGPAIEVAAFREAGGRPEVPGPLIRVRTGTTIVATVRNTLTDSTISIHGLVTRPAATDDSIVLRPGESRTVRFAAGAPGTYLYAAMIGKRDLVNGPERDQVSGALIVDPAAGSPADRILVINIWGDSVDSSGYRNALTINGRSWPHDERMQMMVGDTVRWRVINASARNHPMHLHGFFFDVSAKGNWLADTLYPPADRRTEVTEGMQPYTTMDMVFVPDRPGNWLFHCHIGFHVVPATRLDPPDAASHDRMSDDPSVHMAGLVVGLTVRPRPGEAAPDRTGARRLRLFVDEGARRSHAPRALGYVLQRGDSPPAADSLEPPSSLLVLTRGQPTDVVVINRLHESAAIHWHGVELESYSDGVPGWSGAGNAVAHMIPASDSFVAHLTLPRAGTFMYHTHLNDFEQLTSGLYGGIVVLEPGQRFDPERDHVYVGGWDGPGGKKGSRIPLVVNGESTPAPLTLAAGVPHRFRFVNIGVAGRFPFSILRDSTLVTWRRLAKDGADLPPSQARTGPARQMIEVGETFDAEFTAAPGEYRLVAGPPARPLWQQRLDVR